MSDPWLELLGNLSLSRTEKEVMRRYEAEPEGRAFLPVADILRSHRLVDEALELLTQGVNTHPGFTVARVVLARELMQKGLIAESWRTLEESPVPLRENLLAQKLRFRLSLLLGDGEVVRHTYRHLTLHQMLDADTKRLGDLLEISGIDKARERLINDLRDKGTDPVLPEMSPSSDPGSDPVGDASAGKNEEFGGIGDAETKELTIGGASTRSPYFHHGDLLEDEGIANFHVVPLQEIFRPGDGQGTPTAQKDGIELDSTTLADIYARQGHYSKALEVYRRLLRMSPGNDMLRRKTAELAKLEQEQRDVDLTVDPTIVDRMETVEIIDRQIKMYNDLLSRLQSR